MAARAIRGGEADLIIAGGVGKHDPRALRHAQGRPAPSAGNAEIYDTTIGWRFVNPKLRDDYGDDTMPSTAENVADDFHISREDQDAFALRSQQKTAAAQASGRLAAEIVPVSIPQRKGDPLVVDTDEHPRLTSVEKLAALKPIVRKDGTVTAGNASGVNDGAAALIIASRRGREAQRPDAAGARPRRRGRRRTAAHHGHRPGAGERRSCSKRLGLHARPTST